MPSTRETVLQALHALLQTQPAPVLRGEVLPERVPATGLLILRDGDPGEPRTSPVASARTIRVADWAPAFPPEPISSGRKNSSARLSAIVSSKAAMPAPEKMLPKTSSTGQTMRAR